MKRHSNSFAVAILSYFVLIGTATSEITPGFRGISARTLATADNEQEYTVMRLPTKSFKLRLYWEKGYKWQDDPREKFWCIDCSGSKCDEGDKLKIKKCKHVRDEFEFVRVNGHRGSLIRARGRNVCMRCLKNSRSKIRMAKCDKNDPAQRWVAMKGAFDEEKFDIRPDTNTDNCVTQHHHPRSGEEVRASTHCDKAHGHKTGFWEFF